MTPDPARRLERLAPPTGRVSIVLDTDTYNEIDDQFALAYALLSPDQIDLEAIYAAPFQNPRSTGPADGMEKSYEEILRVLERVGASREGRVFRGSDRFLPGADHPVESDAARDLVDRAMARPDGDPLYVVAIAAITNVASAILMEPRILDRIVVVWLCGQPHDWPTTVEFNLCQDVPASQAVFDCGVPLVHIPCKNVAEHLRTTQPEVQHYARGQGDLASYLLQIFSNYADNRFAWSKPLWDISAVAYCVNPAWVPTIVVPSPRLTSKHTWSRDPARHSIRVALDVNRDAIYGDLFRKLEKR